MCGARGRQQVYEGNVMDVSEQHLSRFEGVRVPVSVISLCIYFCDLMKETLEYMGNLLKFYVHVYKGRNVN